MFVMYIVVIFMFSSLSSISSAIHKKPLTQPSTGYRYWRIEFNKIRGTASSAGYIVQFEEWKFYPNTNLGGTYISNSGVSYSYSNLSYVNPSSGVQDAGGPSLGFDNNTTSTKFVLYLGTATNGQIYNSTQLNALTDGVGNLTPAASVTLDYGSKKIINSYTWWSGDDSVNRDPMSWKILASNDNVTFTTQHTVTDNGTTTSRKTNVGTFNFTIV
jgi:hypothetical protein